MATIPPLRPQEDSADAERSDVLRQAAPVRTAALTAILACAFLLVAGLVGLGRLDPSEPGFLSDALGPEESGAPLERTPAPGVGVRIHSEGYTVTRWGDSVSVVGEDVGGAEWRHHVHGVTRTTEFGAETIIVDGGRTEAFFTVTERQGERTWRWQLATRLVPRLGRDGSVSFLDPTRRRVSGLVVDPVRILDEDGHDVTPEGLRWGLEKRGSSWWVTLELDDRDLPLPYVIDPAVAYRNALPATTTGATSLDIDVPAGVQANDLLVAHVARPGNAGINTPTGWTAAGGTNNGNFIRQATFYRVATSSEPASYTWTWTGTQAAAGGMIAYYGVKGSSPLDVVGTASTANNTTSITAPGLTTSANDALVLAFFASNSNSTYSVAAGMAERHDVGTTGISNATDDMTQASAGATGNKTSTATVSGRVVGHQVAFNVDDVAPSVSQLDPGTPLSGTVVVDGSASDQDSAVAEVQFQRSPAGADTWTDVGSADTSSPYSASFDTTAVADGLYDLRAVATDVAGNSATSTAVVNRQVDNTAPSSTTAFPAAATTYGAAGWNAGCGTSGFCGTYSDGSGSGVSAVEVSIRQGAGNYWSGGSFSSGTEVWNAAGLSAGNWSYAFAAASFPADGSYTVRVRAVDAAGNTESPAARTFTIDTTAPQTTIDSSPANPTASTDASFDFSASEGGSSFECRLDGGAWGACTSPKSYAGLVDGSHTFDVRASDAVGNQDASPASYTWLVDTTAPTSTTSFPASAGEYNAAGWDAGCATAGLCGTYGDGSGSGVAAVEVSIRRGSGNYWNGTAFASGSEVWNAASLAGGNWSYALAASSFPADGDYTVRVRAVDAVANTQTPASRTFTYDTTDPSALHSFPAASGNYTNATWDAGCATSGFCGSHSDSGSAVQSVQVSVRRVSSGQYWNGTGFSSGSEVFHAASLAGGNWSYAFAAADFPADGDYTVHARATDDAGNTESGPSRTFRIDNAAPTSTTSFPAASATYSTAAWDAGCAAPGLCGSQGDGSGSGVSQVEVTLRQGSGNYWNGTGFASATEVWNAATLAGGNWSLAFAAASFPADGDYTVRVRATDAAGNVETPGSRTFTIDRAAPQTTIDSSPADPTSSTGASFGFSSSEGGSSFQCRLDGGSWGACTSPESYAGLADGSHTFDVRATDGAGNQDASPASYAWVVDATAPTSSTAFPAASGSYTAAEWDAGCATAGLCGAYGDGSGSGVVEVEVSIRRGNGNYWDGSGFTSASEVWNDASLAAGTWSYALDSSDLAADGGYTVRVRARDAAGNTETPASRTLTYDATAPGVATDFPAADDYNAAGWTAGCATTGLCGTYSDAASGVAEVEISIRRGTGNYWNGSGFSSGTEVWNDATLAAGDWEYAFDAADFPADGDYTVRVRAADAAGNTTGPAGVTFAYDTTGPQTTIDSSPSDPTGSAGASFDFSASEGGSSFECRLDGGSWGACTSPQSYTGLADGSHTFDVRATDPAGNSDPSPASFTWLVDTTAPGSTTTFPAAAGDYNAAGWNAGCATSGLCGTYADGTGSGVQTVEVSIRQGTGDYWDGSGFASATEVWNTAALAAGDWLYALDAADLPADGGFTVRVRATDEVGNAETPASRGFDFDTTDPSALLTFPAAGGEYSTAGWNAGCATTGLCGTYADATSGVAQVELSVRSVASGLYWDGDSFDAAVETFFAAGLAGGDWSYAFPAAGFGADGQYTVHIRATDGAGNTEAGPSRTFRFDDTDPGAVVGFPTAGGTYNVAAWDAGCAAAGLCGTASDGGSGVAQVELSLKRVGADLYWDGDSFDAAGETFFAASFAAGSWSWSFDGADFPADGSYTAHVRASDGAGNTETGPVRTFAIDTTAPQTTIDSAPADPTTSTSADFDVSASEGGSTLECRLDGGAWAACSSPQSYTGLADGSHTFEVRATDAAGNVDASPASFTWTVDTAGPSSAIVFPAAAGEYNGAGWNGGCPTSGLCGTYGDGGGSGVQSVQVSIQRVSTGLYWDGASFSAPGETLFGATLAGGDWSRSFPASSFPADGSYTVRAFATDAAGNAESPASRTFAFDDTAPTGSLTAPAEGAAVRGAAVAVSSDSADSGAGVASAEFQRRPAGGGAWTPVDTDTTAPYAVSWDTTALADGDYELRVLTTDQAGNTFTSPTRTVTVDNTAPGVSIVAPTGYVNAGSADPFTVSATSPDGDVVDVELFRCSDASAGCGSGTWVSLGVDATAPYSAAWAIDPDGNRALRAVVRDAAGNTGTDVVDVTVDRTNPTGGLTGPADGAFVTATVAVSSDSADGGSGVDSAAFERRPAGGGAWTPVGADATAPYSVSWDTTALADGDYELRVVTTDLAGNAFTSGLRTVTVDNSAPSAPVVTLSESSPFAHAAGTEIFVNTAQSGTYDVEATSGDAHSGIDRVRFPGPTDDFTSPYGTSYSFDDLAGAQTVTAYNGVGLTAASPFTVTPDTAGPAGGSVSYPDGYDADGDVAVTVDAGTDALSGLAPGSAVLERRTAALADGSCDSFAGGWSPVTSPDTVASGLCAQYRYRVSDRVGNETVYSSGDVVKVDLAAPSAPVLTLSESSPFAHVAGTEIFINTAETGTYDVEAASSDPAAGLEKVAFPGGIDDSSEPYAQSYDFDDLSGTQTVTAHDRAGNTAGSDFEVTEDVSAPSTTDDTASIGSAWQPAPVTVTLAPSDARSGVAATYYTTDGSVPTTASAEGTSVDLTADGVYTIRYFSVDNVGNVEPVRTAFEDIRIDRTNPAAPAITLSESSPFAHVAGDEVFVNTGQAGSYDVEATSSDGGSGLEKVSFPGGVDDTTSPYSASYAFGDLTGGQTVTAHDLAGNTASATFTVTPDTTAPAGGFVSYPDGQDADGVVTVTFDAGTDALVGLDTGSAVLERQTAPLAGGACDPFAGGWSVVTSPDTIPADTCARYRYRVSDRVGNEAVYTSAAVVKVDPAPPETTIDAAPADPSADASPSFQFSASEAGSTFECRLDGGAWTACTSPAGVGPLADGGHTFEVRASDGGGNTDPTPASHGWTVDTDAPETTLDSAPPDPSTEDTPSFSFSADEAGASFECRLDGGAWAPCTSPEPAGPLADGPHTFAVRAVDAAGNVDGTPAQHAWTVDTTAPETTLDAAPADPDADPTPDFAFSADEPGSTFECRLDGGSWAPCPSPVTAGPLADGPHAFDVRATDPAGNTDATPAQHAWSVNAAAPTVAVVQPSGYVNAADADPYTVRATSPDGDLTGVELFRCSDASTACATGSWVSLGTDATAPYEASWPLDADGPRALRAVATDTGSNTGENVVTVTIDRSVPATSIDSAPSDPSASGTAAFAFSASEGGVTFECRLDGGSWTACASPESYTGLADGAHSFAVRAADAAGNVDATPASFSWTVDTAAPETTIDAAPGDPSSSPAPSFEFSADEAGVTFECRLDGGAWTACTSPEGYAGLADGSHTFQVRATDAAGTTDPSPASHTWTVDATPPGGGLADPGQYLRGTIALGASPTDEGAGVQSADFQLSPAGADTWTTIDVDTADPYAVSWDTTGEADGLYDLRVVITDNAGNVTPSAVVEDRVVDNTVPSATMDDPGAYLRATVALTSTTSDAGSGVASVAYQRSAAGAGAWTPVAASWDTTAVADGLYDLRVVVTDNAGNSTTSAPVGNRQVDNTKPSLSSSGPADGSTVAAAGTLAVVAGEDVAGIANAELDGAPAPAPIVAGDTVTFTSAFGNGPHVLAGELEDLAGNRQPIRVHFTVWSGATADYPYVEKNSFAAAASALRTASDTATLTVPPGAWSGAPDGDWLVVRLDPQPATGLAGGFQAAGDAIDVTAYWALSGGSVTSFALPLELEIDNALEGVIPATFEDGAWRGIEAVPGSGLPAGWSDGFERDGTNVRILTRHLTQFTLLRDLQAPTVPGGFKGALAGKGFRLAWSASRDNSGLVSAYRVFANGAVLKTVDGNVLSTAMGTFRPSDTRSFQVAAVDEAGNASARSYSLRAVPRVTKLTLAAAKRALTKRGFKVGRVTYRRSTTVPKGRAIAAGATGLRRVGTRIALSVSKGSGSSRRPVAGAAVAPPPAPPSSPAPAPGLAPPPAAPAPSAPAQAFDGPGEAEGSEGGLLALPFDRVRSAGFSELRQELGFGILLAAFSVAVAAALRARRPLGASAGGADQDLLWDTRLLRRLGRVLRLTGR